VDLKRGNVHSPVNPLVFEAFPCDRTMIGYATAQLFPGRLRGFQG
jgi:hypothetical protein